jgi:hypothetical protein
MQIPDKVVGICSRENVGWCFQQEARDKYQLRLFLAG